MVLLAAAVVILICCSLTLVSAIVPIKVSVGSTIISPSIDIGNSIAVSPATKV